MPVSAPTSLFWRKACLYSSLTVSSVAIGMPSSLSPGLLSGGFFVRMQGVYAGTIAAHVFKKWNSCEEDEVPT